MFKAIQSLYRHGRISMDEVAAAVARGILTAEQFREITGAAYPGDGEEVS